MIRFKLYIFNYNTTKHYINIISFRASYMKTHDYLSFIDNINFDHLVNIWFECMLYIIYVKLSVKAFQA